MFSRFNNIIFFFVIGVLIIASCNQKSTNNITEPIIKYNLITKPNPSDAGLINPSDTTTYDENTAVQLEAVPNKYWLFNEWSNDLQGNENPIDVVMDKDKTIIANFIKVQHPLNIQIVGNGTVNESVISAKTNDYNHGAIILLTAIPDSGWIFDSWNGDIVGTNNPTQITIDTSKSVIATFIQTFTISLNITGNGSVQKIPDKNLYPIDTSVQLTAIPDSGWIFGNWSGDVQDTSKVISIQMNTDKTINALFNEIIQPKIIWKYWDGTQEVFQNEFGWLNPQNLYVRINVDATPYFVSKIKYRIQFSGNWENWQELYPSTEQQIYNFDIDITNYEGEGSVQFIALNSLGMISDTTIINYKYDKTPPTWTVVDGSSTGGFNRIGLGWSNEGSDTLSGPSHVNIYRNVTNTFPSSADPIGRTSAMGVLGFTDHTATITSIMYYYWAKVVDFAGNEQTNEQALGNATSFPVLPGDVGRR